MRVGAAFVGVSGIAAIAGVFSGNLGGTVPAIATLSLAGIAAIANGVLRLPGWARLRARQMEAITSQLALETSSDVPDDKAST